MSAVLCEKHPTCSPSQAVPLSGPSPQIFISILVSVCGAPSQLNLPYSQNSGVFNESTQFVCFVLPCGATPEIIYLMRLIYRNVDLTKVAHNKPILFAAHWMWRWMAKRNFCHGRVFSLELGGEMKPLSCVEVVAMDSPGYGLYGTWTLSVSPRWCCVLVGRRCAVWISGEDWVYCLEFENHCNKWLRRWTFKLCRQLPITSGKVAGASPLSPPRFLVPGSWFRLL